MVHCRNAEGDGIRRNDFIKKRGYSGIKKSIVCKDHQKWKVIKRQLQHADLTTALLSNSYQTQVKRFVGADAVIVEQEKWEGVRG